MLTDLETSPSRRRQCVVVVNTEPTVDIVASPRESDMADWHDDPCRDGGSFAISDALHLCCNHGWYGSALAATTREQAGTRMARLLHASAQQHEFTGSDRAWALAESVILIAACEMAQSLLAARLGSSEMVWDAAQPLKALRLPLLSALAAEPVCASYGNRATTISHAHQLELPTLSIDVIPEMQETPASRERMIEMLAVIPDALKASACLSGLLGPATQSMEQRLYPGFSMHSQAVIKPLRLRNSCLSNYIDVPHHNFSVPDLNIINFISSKLDTVGQGNLDACRKMKSRKDGNGGAIGGQDNERPAPQPGTRVWGTQRFDVIYAAEQLPEESVSVASDLDSAYSPEESPFSRERMYQTLLGRRKGPSVERG